MSEVDTLDVARLLPGLEAELKGWKGKREQLDQRINARERLLDALKTEVALGLRPLFVDTNGGADTTDTGIDFIAEGPNGTKVVAQVKSKPSTGDAILRVLNGTGRFMSKAAIFQELESRD